MVNNMNNGINLSDCQLLDFTASPLPDFRSGENGAVTPPCLYRNNCTEKDLLPSDVVTKNCNKFTSYHKKAADTVFANAKRLISQIAPSINHVVFFTLTFPDSVKDYKEASKRFRSFNAHYLAKSPHFGTWMSVKETTEKGVYHFHMLMVMSGDVRTGFDFEKYDVWLKRRKRKTQNKKCPTGSSYLRSIWAEMYDVLPRYGFGQIFTVEPLKSDSPDAMGRYIGKYISKSIESRKSSELGMKRVTYSKDFTRNSPKFSWATPNAKLWRLKYAAFANCLGCSDQYEVALKLGSGHVWRYLDVIMSMDLTEEKNSKPYKDALVVKMTRIKALVEALEVEREFLSESYVVLMRMRRDTSADVLECIPAHLEIVQYYRDSVQKLKDDLSQCHRQER